MDPLTPWQITLSVLPMYGLIILGGILRRVNVLRREADTSIMALVINCLYPCLILDKILASESVRNGTLVAWTLPIGFSIVLIGLLLAKLLGKTFQIPHGEKLNTFATTAGIQNYGFAAVPIVMALFPSDLLGVLFVHSLGVEIALWTFGIATLQGSFASSFRSLLSAPIIAVITGLLIVFSGAGEILTTQISLSPLFTILNWLGACSFPIALMLVGATLFDELKDCLPSFKVASASFVTRMLIMPVIILGIIYLLPIPKNLALVLAVQAAMPSAVMPIVLSRLYNGHPATAGQVVIVTQIIGIFTIPLWITIGLQMIN